jgi:hypothetical protein
MRPSLMGCATCRSARAHSVREWNESSFPVGSRYSTSEIFRRIDSLLEAPAQRFRRSRRRDMPSPGSAELLARDFASAPSGIPVRKCLGATSIQVESRT